MMFTMSGILGGKVDLRVNLREEANSFGARFEFLIRETDIKDDIIVENRLESRLKLMTSGGHKGVIRMVTSGDGLPFFDKGTKAGGILGFCMRLEERSEF